MEKGDMVNELKNANELLRTIINLNKGVIKKLEKEILDRRTGDL